MTETTGIFITLNGKRMSLSDFLKEEEEKQIQKEKIKLARKQTKDVVMGYSEIQKTRSSMRLKRVIHGKKQSSPDVVVSTKVFTDEEILQQEEILMQKTRLLQQEMLRYLTRHPQKWFTPRKLMTAMNVPPEKFGFTNFTVSKITAFLSENGLLSSEANPDGRGRQFRFTGSANPDDSQEFDKLMALFTTWLTNKNRDLREKAKIKKSKIQSPEPKIQEPTIVSSPEAEIQVPEVKAPQVEVQKTVETIQQPPLEIKGESEISTPLDKLTDAIVKVIKMVEGQTSPKLTIALEVRFGFLKEG